MKKTLKTTPAVFAVGDNYQVIVPVASETVMWVKVGDKCFYDESNGILRSGKRIHKMLVPAEILNKEGSYTICYRRVKKRKAYFSKTHSVEEISFNFKRVQGEAIRAYHIADAHNMIKEPVKCAQKFIKAKLPCSFEHGSFYKPSQRGRWRREAMTKEGLLNYY